MKMLSLKTTELDPRQVARILLGGVSPRPIALVSTVSKEGVRNLAPYSFFNAFGSNPPVIGFSSGRRPKGPPFKDTYNNLVETGECVVQVVSHAMVEQVNVTSTDYGPEVDEFEKSGLTALSSEIVSAPRVKESPFQMECKLWQMIPLGEKPGAGNLALCEVLLFHIAEELDWENGIRPLSLDAVGRLGGSYYLRPRPESVFEVVRPIGRQGIGYDQLPEKIRNSTILSGNDLGRLANCSEIPNPEKIQEIFNSSLVGQNLPIYRTEYDNKVKTMGGHEKIMREFVEKIASRALEAEDMDFAWAVLMRNN